jgi:two-component system, chemotaxis family, chemotaxis protein CheY
MKILIVDDAAASCMILEKILSPWGSCAIAANGALAVESFRTALDEGKPYDLVCLDIVMPVMDGHRALELIHEEERLHGVAPYDHCKVVMVSAQNDAKNVVKAFNNRCDAYITKPFTPEVFRKKLEGLGFRRPSGDGERKDRAGNLQQLPVGESAHARGAGTSGAL